MRTIKFRGKIKQGEWVCDSLLKDDYENCCIVEFADHHEQWHDVEPKTIGQFIGLYDCHHKEIYEGDIVNYDDTLYIPIGTKYKGEVVVYRGAWCVKHYKKCFDEYFYSPLFVDDFASKKTTILGNVYDNPELERR